MRSNLCFFFSSRRRNTRCGRDWSSDVCSSDLPFHNEKTPSFNVDPERRSYRCFGCGESGDAFTWLEKQDGLDAGEALRTLAERAGVELTRRAPQERETEKRLLAIHETAHFYFRQAL